MISHRILQGVLQSARSINISLLRSFFFLFISASLKNFTSGFSYGSVLKCLWVSG